MEKQIINEMPNAPSPTLPPGLEAKQETLISHPPTSGTYPQSQPPQPQPLASQETPARPKLPRKTIIFASSGLLLLAILTVAIFAAKKQKQPKTPGSKFFQQEEAVTKKKTTAAETKTSKTRITNKSIILSFPNNLPFESITPIKKKTNYSFKKIYILEYIIFE